MLTTHLVCAPDDLATPAVVTEWLVPAGVSVLADEPLVRLAVAGEVHIVITPTAGVVLEHCVAIGEPLSASDLLAMIEADEPDFGGLLIPAEDAAENLAVPACRLGYRPSPSSIDPDALAMCAALGIAPDEVPVGERGQLGRIEVERHVRAELRRLAAIRRLLSTDGLV
ncbi:hypothetical protein ACUHMQ_03310 [Chitinimonas sp. PSY-7]|uniref:hypothetical protein n=1 Tax=Chitinimonas sp. PSY-7 TaxID=3459088 RepID=UPI00403FD906